MKSKQAAPTASKLNQAISERDYTQWSTGIYSRSTELAKHLKNQLM